ncbi:chorismate-binding protein [Ignatzschineria sp. LJL83]
MSEAVFKRSEIYTISREISIDFEPFTLFKYLVKAEEKPYAMLFESARTDDQSALKSMMITKVSLRITALKDIVTVTATSKIGNTLLTFLQSELRDCVIESGEDLGNLYAKFQFENDQTRFPRGVLTILDPLLSLKNPEFDPFIGGLFGYDLVGEYYQVNIPEKGRERDLCLYFAEEMIVLDHQAKRATYEHLYQDLGTSRMESYRTFSLQAEKYETLARKMSEASITNTTKVFTISSELSTTKENNINNAENQSSSELVQNSTQKGSPQSYPQDNSKHPIVNSDNGVEVPDSAPFSEAVASFIEQIHDGKLQQIVPSRAFTLPCDDPFASYAILKQAYPSPYLFYLHDSDFTLFGASPESALKYMPETRELELYPIAGTKKRGMIEGEIDLALDLAMEQELKTDKKEVAEHLMLVDLAKEDLAQISEVDSIAVKDLMKIDRYRYVMHLVSRVSGKLKTGLSPIDAYLAVMNMGTLTGAPKVYAMEEIYRYETEARGSYGGAIGYIQGTMYGDRFDSAIVIRSAFVKDGIAKVQAGAGIVADSIVISEIEETENKASSVIMAILKSQLKAS